MEDNSRRREGSETRLWTDPEFPGYEFEGAFPHIGGDVPFRLLGAGRMRWAIRAGTSYSPEIHQHGHTLRVERGEGRISVGGEEQNYKGGDEFSVEGNVPHGFIEVREPTVVLQTLLREAREK